ncbi:MAG: hypothetical protein DRH33_01900 [Candidatus Nealsonbacteria bacterium]|nr:MAG: hypothetical protein DRH33_01900 [Candidatus Nealsonbacteria bacterium]
MRKEGIFRKILGLMVATVLIGETIILSFVIIQETRSVEKAIVERAKVLAETIAKTIEVSYLDFTWPFETLKKISDSETTLFLWIVKPNGEIFLADNPRLLGKKIKDPFLGTEVIRIKDINYQREKGKLIVHPLQIEVKEKPWTLYLGVSLKPVRLAQIEIFLRGVIMFVLTIALVIIISFYFAKKITQPLEQLRKGAEIIGKGNFEHRIKLKTGDEIEELGRTFNQMAEDLRRSRAALEESETVLKIKVKARTRELEELAQSLEERVKERTKELQERVNELERFHRLTVGRELKMIELKEEIKRLKAQIRELKRSAKSKKTKN